MAKLKTDGAKAVTFEDAKNKVDPPTLTDAGNAIRLVRRHGKNIRYIAEFGQWLIWDGRRWSIDTDGQIMRLAKQVAREIYAEAVDAQTAAEAAAIGKHAKLTESRRGLEAMIALARSEPGITISQKLLDADLMALGVENGYIDLTTGKLCKPARDKLITKQAATVFDPLAKCPVWEQFLMQVMADDQRLVDYLQRWAGYGVTGLTSEQILAFLHGTGANGKSTFLVTLRTMLGGYAMQSPADTLLARREGGINNDVARLRGARMVICVESEDGRRLSEPIIKQLSGGDPVTARYLHAEYFEFTPECKIVLATNHRPIYRGDDDGMNRRLHLVPFTVTIPPEKRDKALPDKLRAESAGILAWAVRGCLEWQRTGLQPPAAVVDATRHYREEMDLVGQWLEEKCLLAETATVQASVAYRSYDRWIQSRGARPMTQMAFSNRLVDRGYKKEKRGVVRFQGIGLLAGDDGGDNSPALDFESLH